MADFIAELKPAPKQDFSKPFADEDLERAARFFLIAAARRMCSGSGCLVCSMREAEVRSRLWSIYQRGLVAGVLGDDVPTLVENDEEI